MERASGAARTRTRLSACARSARVTARPRSAPGPTATRLRVPAPEERMMIKRFLSLRWRRLRRSGETGQSLVEFALMLPFLLLMLMGTLDVGRLYFAYVAIQNAAGEGALYAAIHPNCIHASDGPDCADPNNAEYRARHESPAGGTHRRRPPPPGGPGGRGRP